MEVFKFSTKTILIFSTQSWGKMRLSKHHYAIALAEKGNKVYYLNPISNKHQAVRISKVKDVDSLFIIDSGIWKIRTTQFHFKFLFKILNTFNTKRIIKKIGREIDVCWNFDISDYLDFSIFKNALKIAHPVDFVPLKNQKNIVGSDVIFSVATEILEEFKSYTVPSCFINHGITSNFIKQVSCDNTSLTSDKTQVGYVGNLMRNDIDHETILKLVKSNPTIDFVFIGNYTITNIGGSITNAVNRFINTLKTLKNVNLKGVLSQNELPIIMRELDVFLICYDKEKDSCRGTNYHKIMEYLGTGKVILSNYVSTYRDEDLLVMPSFDETNEKIISLFNKIINNIGHYNSKENQDKRINFAGENTYIKQIDRIEKFINLNPISEH
jgi:glycosyltransferase involved in cell wall biosynthesis